MSILAMIEKRHALDKPAHFKMPRLRNSYQAGLIDRLTASFSSSSLSADREVLASLKTMRGRSRNLAMNNVYMRKFLESLVVNVIGHEGIVLQNQAKDGNGKFDEEANNSIEEAWYEFGEEGVCDVTGELSLNELLSLHLKSTARDGGSLLRIVRGWKNNKYRFALQLIEDDLLDENYNRDLPNGNKIVMGVEKDRWGRRIAYHLFTKHPGDYSFAGMNYDIIPAADIIPLFSMERIGQTRGVPWAYASMLMLNNIGAYTDAAIINARVGASKMGFYKSTDGSVDYQGDKTDTDGEFIEEMEPGIFSKLPLGWDFQEFNPKYPDSEFPEFNRAMLRGTSAGLLMAYSSISNDLSDVNFSSIRSGKIDERDIYRFIQKWFIRKTLQKIFPLWLDTALMTGAINLPYTKYDKFNAATWQARGFDWVDPKTDIEADMIAINFGLKTRAEVLAGRGKDLRDVFGQLKREKEIADEYGLSFTTSKMEAAANAEKPEEENENIKEVKEAIDENKKQLSDMLEKTNDNQRELLKTLLFANKTQEKELKINIDNKPQDINLNLELKQDNKSVIKTGNVSRNKDGSLSFELTEKEIKKEAI